MGIRDMQLSIKGKEKKTKLKINNDNNDVIKAVIKHLRYAY